MKLRQLSLEIENQPGRVYGIVQLLADADVKVRAISVSETGMSGVLRMIVSDLKKARQVLMDHEVPASVDEVLALSCREGPAAFATLLKPLHDWHINVHYLYAVPATDTGDVYLIIRAQDNDKALEALSASGVEPAALAFDGDDNGGVGL